MTPKTDLWDLCSGLGSHSVQFAKILLTQVLPGHSLRVVYSGLSGSDMPRGCSPGQRRFFQLDFLAGCALDLSLSSLFGLGSSYVSPPFREWLARYFGNLLEVPDDALPTSRVIETSVVPWQCLTSSPFFRVPTTVHYTPPLGWGITFFLHFPGIASASGDTSTGGGRFFLHQWLPSIAPPQRSTAVRLGHPGGRRLLTTPTLYLSG